MDHLLARSVTLRWWPQVIQNATPLSYSAKDLLSTRAILTIDRLRSIVPKDRWRCVNMAAGQTASVAGARYPRPPRDVSLGQNYGYPGVMFRIIPLKKLVVGLFALLVPPGLSAQEVRSHSVLLLDQSDLRGPFYYQLSAGLRGALGARAEARVTIYGENLDLTRFGGAAYEESLKRHLKEKYRDRPIGVIVANGARTLEHVLHWREELWPGIPIVFALLDATQ